VSPSAWATATSTMMSAKTYVGFLARVRCADAQHAHILSQHSPVSSHSDVEITYVQARAPARTHTHTLSLTHTKTHICHEHTSGKERSQARTIPKPHTCP
jgi:hypothetical protein